MKSKKGESGFKQLNYIGMNVISNNWIPENELWLVDDNDFIMAKLKNINNIIIEPTLKGRLTILWQLLTKKQVKLYSPFFNMYTRYFPRRKKGTLTLKKMRKLFRKAVKYAK